MRSVFTVILRRCSMRLLLCGLIIALFTQVFIITPADAADTTDITSIRVVPGPATLSGSPEIIVTALYVGDDDGDNDITIEWGLDGDSYSGTHTSILHPTSPYIYTITPLDNNDVYQIRITISDPDNGADIVKVITGQKPYNPMMHNAVSTGSTKWANGWGTADAGDQYGEFVCKTCHARKSGNIKRIRKDWSDASLPAVPAKLDSATIVFSTNADGTAEFALDDTTDHATSNRICEACHTQTSHHRYNVNGLGLSDHKSSNDCIGCHNHRNAFAPAGGCSACHGGNMSGITESSFWPDSVVENTDNAGSADDAGEHQVHMTRLAATVYGYTLQDLLDSMDSSNEQIVLCNYCHENPGADGDHMTGDDAELTRFLRMNGAADAGSAGVYDTGSATCSNIDCHNSKAVMATNNWYAGSDSGCLLCHTEDSSNGEALVDPTSGLHYSATPNGALLHDAIFNGGGSCLSCHTTSPSIGHFNGMVDTPDSSIYNFQSSSGIDIKLNSLADDTDDTCAANCHSDGGRWYRFWHTDAFDGTAFDTANAAAVTATIANQLPARCRGCHGEFVNGWAEGSAHYIMDADNVSSGSSHNSQNPSLNPGAACVDCHLYPDHDNPGNGLIRHENNKITITDDQIVVDEYTPYDDPTAPRVGIYCAPCHENAPDDGNDANTFEYSTAFPDWVNVEVVATTRNPEYTCFSGANGCHGDSTDNWWPHIDSTDPTSYPNREGAHFEHGTTIGELLAEQANAAVPGSRIDADGDGRVDAIQEDRNNTCNFCHPMQWNSYRAVWESRYHRTPTPETGNVETDVFGGFVFPGADNKGVYSSGDPSFGADVWSDIDTDGTTGFAYQLEPDPLNPGQDVRYPLDHDGEYWQYLEAYKTDSSVRHGVCSQVACHSNSPFTPQWYGDHQAPGQITDLVGYTHNQDLAVHDIYEYDAPGTVHLHWTAPGDNGDFNGTAYEYKVYYSTAGVITDANLGSATRAGGAATTLRQGEAQEMVVDGLAADTQYWFAVVTKDQPTYEDDNQDGIYDVFVADGLKSVVGASAAVMSHPEDRSPTFWGINQVESHDTGGAVNLSWDAARDHTLPLTYLVYWSDYSLKTHLAYNGALPTLTKPAQYDGGVYSFGFTEGTSAVDPPTTGGADYYIYATMTSGMSYQTIGLGTGILYNFLVRAEDGHDQVGDGSGIGNIDDNSIVAMAMANTMPQEIKDTMMSVLDGDTAMTQTDPENPTWGGAGSAVLSNGQSVTITDGADLDGATARESWMQGISLDMTVTNGDRKLPQEFQVELGHDGSGFTAIGSPVTVGIGRRSSRVLKVGLSSVEGIVPANANLAVRITSTVPSSGSVDDITFEWGDDTLKGQLMVITQPINHQPSAPVLGGLSRATGGYVDITWSTADDGTPSDGGQTLHYDVFGSADNGATWPFIIGTNLTDADAIAGVRWDTVGDGLDRFNGSGIFNCQVRIDTSDGYLYELTPGSGTWTSHRTVTSGTITVVNSKDDEAPAAVTISHEEPRPKQGAAFLHWIAVGNDGYNHGTRAAYYDIRFRKIADGVLVSGNWGDVATVQVDGEPVPGFAGTAEEFELLNMAPDTNYQTAIVTCDSGEDDISGNVDDNCSGLSNVYAITSGQYYCGICHSTPPDEPDTKGTHRQHGYTLEDCAKCHGDGTGPDDGIGAPGPNDVTQYDGRHYDGVINIGWAKDSSGNHLMMAQIAPTDTSGVSIDQGSGVIYNDPDGAGGYNSNGAYTATANTDSGRCMNFTSANATGCHGPFSPQWAPDTAEPNPAAPACSDCHGDKSAARDLDPYGRIWDCNVAGEPSELVKASPPQANHGGTADTDRYVGAHEKHLNSSFRFAKGDSCRLCHKDTMDLGLHADGNVDIIFDVAADQDEATPATVDQTHASVDVVGASCGSLNNLFCHDTGANWAEPGAKCNSCHGMAGKIFNVSGTNAADSEIGHVWDGGKVRDCEHCHVKGHPQSPDGIVAGDPDALLVNNNAAIGINYRSGGIHLRQYSGNGSDVPFRTTMNDASIIDTLAETCWGCHEDNGISEWGTNTSVSTGSSSYNFGTLDQAQWVGAIWTSGHPAEFAYKTGYIQSTHTTDPTGTSEVTWDSANGRYNETADPIAKIRCSNCHDVHDSNQAPGDTMSGRPYLRGTWKANPYEEDGAPWSSQSYTQPAVTSLFLGAVPRGAVEYNELGGYYIDQNNVVPGTGNSTQTSAVYPTSGWTISSSAGLCVICHGTNVDAMDQRTSENLWLGTNGHSNSALGGDFSNGANIFDYSHGRPAPLVELWGGGGRPNSTAAFTTQVADMVYLTQGEEASAGGGYRGTDGNAGKYLPAVTDGKPYGFNSYNWGASVDAGTTDNMYHQFSCSKCHNPHASRLPKLMITNCLDIRHNTWDDSNSSLQTKYTNANLSAVDRDQRAAYYASAQNCHRFDPARSGIERGGWNKVTPWVKDNKNNIEHKGASDTSYGDTSPTFHKFVTEPSGW